MDEQAGGWVYEICVEGHLDDVWAEWFEGLVLARGREGISILTGPVADQAALHGLLTRVRDLGLVLLSVKLLNHHRRAATTGDDSIGTEATE